MKKSIIIILLLATAWCINAQEQPDNDFGIWGAVDASYTFKKKTGLDSIQKVPSRWSMGIRFEYRSRDLSRQTNLWFVRPYIGFKATNWLKLNLYYDCFNNHYKGYYQHRILLDATESLSKNGLTVSLRERFVVAYAPKAANGVGCCVPS